MKHATLGNLPPKLKEEYLKVAPNQNNLIAMFTKDRNRMLEFKDWNPEDLHSIQAPAFIINGDADIVRPEHAVELFRLLPHGQLAILPGEHGAYIGEITTLHENNPIPSMAAAMIEAFLDAPMPETK